jgi:hypothetical protein
LPTFVFLATQVGNLSDEERRFTLSSEEITLLNPNTKTAPIFRNRTDAELGKAIARLVPILVQEPEMRIDCWGFTYREVIHMSHMSKHFVAAGKDANLNSNKDLLPLYEAKMIHHFDHRWMSFGSNGEDTATPINRLNPTEYVRPRYWIAKSIVQERLAGDWSKTWCVGWRDITRSTDERTLVMTILPNAALGNTLSLALIKSELAWCLPAVLSTFIADYAARQRLSGTHLNMRILRQIPAITPGRLRMPNSWRSTRTIAEFMQPRVLELTYTAWDLEPFARDCGWNGPPFQWDEERRFLLRCELDATFFHLYLGTESDWCRQPDSLTRLFPGPRQAVDYILDTFPIVRRKDEQAHGEYRTKRIILEIYDEMWRAMESGAAYQTRLDPPPANGWIPPEPAREEMVMKPALQPAETADGEQSDLFAWQAEDPQQRLKFDGTE